MIKNFSKIISVLISVTIILSAFQVCQAKNLSEMMSDIETFKSVGENNQPDISEAIDPIVDIGSILTAIGVAVMLGVVSYMGIKYLTSGPEARAKLKVQLIGVVVAGLVIFGAYYIWDFVVGVGEKL